MSISKRNRKKKFILGVTGSFGSGKTTVAGMLKGCGVKVIDADRIAHELIKPASPVYKKVIKAFGTAKRHKLAALVFNNKNLLRKLNNIIHPAVIRRIKRQIIDAPGEAIVLDAPLLIEAGLVKLIDKLIVVKLSRKEQIKRLIKKTGLNKKDLTKRIDAQIPLKYKVILADFIIDNSGTVKGTRRQVGEICKILDIFKKCRGFNSHT